MLTRISVLAWALLAVAGVDAKGRVINKENGNIALHSDMGRALMQQARRVDQNQYDEDYDWTDMDTSFLAGYSVKFQGCHHVQQWNPDAQDEEDVRIMTKRLVRFRLCPSTDCLSDLSGCTSKYGDYVVDMSTFLDSFVEAGGDASGQYGQYNGQNQQQNNGGGRELEGFDMSEYTSCTEFEMRRRLDQNQNGNNNYGNGNANGADGYYDGDGNYVYYNNEELDYYVGPYCADQGGEIHLGLFTDDTCTSFAQNGETMFYQSTGYKLPYSEYSMVSLSCMGCSQYTDDGYGVSEFCSDIYSLSGKCETRMAVDYPNESSCSYIEGIKIIREDGVIRTTATKKSKAAAVCIGIFLTIAVLLAGYVYYLRTKLGRAKINLAAASQTLT